MKIPAIINGKHRTVLEIFKILITMQHKLTLIEKFFLFINAYKTIEFKIKLIKKIPKNKCPKNINFLDSIHCVFAVIKVNELMNFYL
jgi:hypothetical protein